jgi:uncharacterized protein (DUF427 family)
MARPTRIEPGPGQESVWDYPRPPRIEASTQHVQVIFNGLTIADTRRAQRVLETSHPPVYYLPPEDVRLEYLRQNSHTTVCEFKGGAVYYDLVIGDSTVPNVAWAYPAPVPAFRAIKGYLAFYPGKVDACLVDGELVQAQAGDFYGGWITKNIVGPFKGAEGTRHW